MGLPSYWMSVSPEELIKVYRGVGLPSGRKSVPIWESKEVHRGDVTI